MSAPRSAESRLVSNRLLRILGLAAVPLILLLLGMLQSRQFEEAREVRERVDRSFEARAQIDAIFSLHQDIETGQRGFALTGNDSFLQPYREALPRMAPALERLDTSYRGQAGREGSVRRLRSLTDAKLRFASDVVRLGQADRGSAAVALIATGRGKAIMDEIRATVGGMKSVEREHLGASIAQAEASRERTKALTYALQAILLLLLAGAAWVIHRSMAATRKAAHQLASLNARQQAIFDAATDGMITHDPHGTIESLNPAAARMYGYAPGALIGRHIGILFKRPPKQEDLEAFLAGIASAPDQAAESQEYGGKRSDGSIFTVDVATSPVPLSDGLHFIAIIRDVTERRRVEQMKTEFVATVSHELRTPLTSIAGSLGLLAGGVAGELPLRAAGLIKIAHSNSERLVRLINDILDIEKIESGKMNFDVKPVALAPLVEQVVQANLAYAQEYGVSFRVTHVGGDAVALADADRLVQVLTNLLSNAAKFSPRGEEVVITIAAGEPTHRVTVADKGMGIPEEFRERIFSKFAQADASDTREKGGTGLGLSIVKQIVTGLGGSIHFDSEEGQGTAFHLDLPAASDPREAASRGRILICQENPAAAQETEKSLRRAGFDSDIAGSSEEVRALAAKGVYAAILMDLSLPGEEAIGLIGHLRADARNASAPILIAAADASGDVSQALAVVDWTQQPAAAGEAPNPGIAKVRDDTLLPCILHIEDDADVRGVVASAFEGHADVDSVVDLDGARSALRTGRYDLVILDLALPGGSGLELLPEMRQADGSPIPVVIFSAQDDEPALARRVEAVLTKSRASLGDLVATVKALLANAR